MLKNLFHSFPAQPDAAGMEGRDAGVVPGTVFMIPQQRIAAAGELYPDLMAAPGVQADVNQRGIGIGEPLKFQNRFFDPLTLPFDHIDLVFPAVLKQQILPDPRLRRNSVNQCPVFFRHGAAGNGL